MKRRILLLNKETSKKRMRIRNCTLSDNDILSCPKCTRKLKVPYERRPAKARCPSYVTVFEARKNEVKKMVTGHFQEFEDEYLETLYEFNERKPGERVRNENLQSILGFPQPLLLK